MFEGLDFAGKTTLIRQLKKELEKDQRFIGKIERITLTQEPGSELLNFCKYLREDLLNKKFELNWKTQLLLFMANRSEHAEKIIKKELEKEKTLIICDRYYLSTLVYQGLGEKKRTEIINRLQEFVTDIKADITFLVDMNQKAFESRLNKKQMNRFDELTKDNFSEMRQTYLDYYEKNKNNEKIIYIDGDLDMYENINTIKNCLLEEISFKSI